MQFINNPSGHIITFDLCHLYLLRSRSLIFLGCHRSNMQMTPTMSDTFLFQIHMLETIFQAHLLETVFQAHLLETISHHRTSFVFFYCPIISYLFCLPSLTFSSPFRWVQRLCSEAEGTSLCPGLPSSLLQGIGRTGRPYSNTFHFLSVTSSNLLGPRVKASVGLRKPCRAKWADV